ncbi:ATP-binding protein [Fulvivirga sp.]|uniref:ATP-binding protein n=2 Tax=Fulvivirga sp. TaxID=1931237 RepID=UPI0032ED4770
MDLRSTSNIANRVRNTKLPRTKPLMPLFEVISNSIHAINEARRKSQFNEKGEIRIKIIRNGDPKVLSELEEIDEYPINSLEIVDNGIGLNDENLQGFVEADTDHKLDIGGKGVGRFVCLKAFDKLIIDSHYKSLNSLFSRTFEFRNTREGFHDFKENESKGEIRTKIVLSKFKEEYQKHAPRALMDVAREVVLHFQLYFISGEHPKIIIENQNNVLVDLENLFKTEFKSDIREKEFHVAENDFKLYLTKSFKAQSHRMHFCAHYRSVKDEGLASRIVDLGKYSIKTEEGNFYYQAFIVGDKLDQHVDLERVGFTFPTEEEEQLFDELTLSNIRNNAIEVMEELLSEYLSEVREAKMEKYRPTINEEMPQYRSVLNYRSDAVKKLPPNMSKQKLDIELYKIEADWKTEIRELGIKLLDEKKDITNLDQYKEKYEKFLTEFNEIGQSELARYVVHRKSVIDLLDDLLNQNDEEKFSDEDIVHSIFFPIRSSSDEVPFDKQNLWLIDERLSYHSFLASDKRFEKIKEIELDSSDRTDLLIYNDALAFSDSQKPPFSSFTIVEFKKPMRNDYQDYDPKRNPLEQTEKYIEALLEGKVKDRNGRFVNVDNNTPFYAYIVCDITPTLEDILKRREFNPTPDGQGYFLFKNRYYNAYFEVIPFDKLLTDARRRNRILFDKLGIDK